MALPQLSADEITKYHDLKLEKLLKQLENNDKKQNTLLSNDDISSLLMYEHDKDTSDDILHKKKQAIVSLLFKELTPHCHNKMEITPSEVIMQIKKKYPDIANGYQELIRKAWESSSLYDGANLAITKKLSLLTLCHQLNEIFKKELASSDSTNFQKDIKAILLAFTPPSNAKPNPYQVWWNILTKQGLNLLENESIKIEIKTRLSDKKTPPFVDNKSAFFPAITADNTTNQSAKNDHLTPK